LNRRSSRVSERFDAGTLELQDFQQDGLIGEGAFAKVFKLRERSIGRVIACKQISKAKVQKSRLHREVLITRRLSHPYIVKYIDLVEDSDFLNILMEYQPIGSLNCYLEENGSYLPESDAGVITDQILDALEYLHQESAVHRDLKPKNVLVSSQSPLGVRLSDFGLSRILNLESVSKYATSMIVSPMRSVPN